MKLINESLEDRKLEQLKGKVEYFQKYFSKKRQNIKENDPEEYESLMTAKEAMLCMEELLKIINGA